MEKAFCGNQWINKHQGYFVETSVLSNIKVIIDNILWKRVNYQTSRLSHGKPLPWPFPVNGMYHCVNVWMPNWRTIPFKPLPLWLIKSIDKLDNWRLFLLAMAGSDYDEGRLGFEFQLPGTFRPSRKILSDAKFPPHSLHYDHRLHHQNVVNTQLATFLSDFLCSISQFLIPLVSTPAMW